MTGSDRTGQGATLTGRFPGTEIAPGTLLAGRFEVKRLLGIGGMGVVHLAHDRDLDVDVALKTLRPELAERPEAFERFRQELLLARQVSSPHVVRIHDLARDGGHWFISMDLVDGESLDRRIDRDGPLPIEAALAIARQLALGLEAAHANGIVHRDLKPSNVLLGADGQALISDFGVARSLGTSGLTQSGALVGTPDYLSPEQARAAPVDARSDLYALGLILYEMLSGRPAFAGGTPAESLSQRIIASPPRLDRQRRDVPAWVARLVDRLLQPSPSRRFQAAADVVAAIDTRHVPRDLRPGRRGLAAAAAALVALALLLTWAPRPGDVPSIPADQPPPDRVVIVVEPDQDKDGSLSAIAELLRLGLDTPGSRALVDAERTRLALTQAGIGSRLPDDAALLADLPATGVIRLGRDGRTALVARIDGSAPRRFEAMAGTGLSDAAAAMARDSGLGTLATDVWPRDEGTLATYGAALALRLSGRAEEATEAFAELTQQAPDFAAGWLALSETARMAGQRGLAEQAARRGAALGTSLSPRLQRWVDLAEGRHDDVLAAQSAWVATRPDDLDARLRLAEFRLEAGSLESAAEDVRAVLARDPQDPRAWFLLGKAAILQGNPREAVEEHLVRALVLYKRGRSTAGEAETTNALGVGYARLGQLEDADEQYRKALSLRRGLGDRRGIASSLRNLAQLAMVQGRLDEARVDLAEAATLFAAIGDNAGAAAVDNELGLLAEERGNYAEALAAYTRSLRAREAARDPRGIAESLNNIGFAHYQLGEYDSAGVFWRQASDAFAGLDDHNGTIRAGQNLGLLAIARGDWRGARRLLEGSLREAEPRQMIEEAAVSHRNLAELGIVEGRLDDAATHLAEARRLFAGRDDQRGLVDAGLLEARLLAAAGEDQAAAAMLARLGPDLEESSLEQRAIAALIDARLRLSSGGDDAARQSLAHARELAVEAGLRVRRLEADVLAGVPKVDESSLDDEVAALGNVPLQLAWLEQRLQRALAEADAGAAVAAYRSVQAVLSRQEAYLGASRLHALGARALAATGEQEESALAEAAARAAAAALAREAASASVRRLVDEGAGRGPAP